MDSPAEIPEQPDEIELPNDLPALEAVPAQAETDKREEKRAGPVAADSKPPESRIWESVKLVLEVAILALVIYVFIFQISIVKGQSMQPSFAEDDRLVIDKLTYRFTDVRRFDVIVFRVAGVKQKDYIKRVIGLPGETIELAGGVLLIDGESVTQDFSFRNQVDYRYGPVETGSGEYFVLGDNRPSSTDSRLRRPGKISEAHIRGRVRARVWPLDRLGQF